ncbi:MAG: chromate transporter [Eubacterium sp.]
MKDSKIFTLLVTFLKIGAFTFGGGYAMIPLVQAEIVDKKGWITEREFIDVIAIAEATPGVIAVNTATFVGYKVGGIWGSAVATFGVVLPSFVIISIISIFYELFKSITWVSYAFQGIRAGVVVLIIGAVVRMAKGCDKNIFTLSVMVVAFIIATFTGINVVFLILGGAIMGIIYQVLLGKGKFDGEM